MYMQEDYAPFQRQLKDYARSSAKGRFLKPKKYVSEWGSNEAEWMESAKLFEDAFAEVHSQNEVLKQYPTSVLNSTAVTDAPMGLWR